MSNLFLGRPAFDPKPFTRINPVAQAENGGWRVYGDWTEALPNDGKAFAPRLNGFREGDLLAFSAEPNLRKDAERDRWIVAKIEPITEVLDFRRVAPEEARRTLVERGVATMMPSTDRVVAALQNGLCVVVKMVLHPTTERWTAEITDLESLPSHTFDPRVFEGDQIFGRWAAVPGVTVGPTAGVLNWCRDSDFLESVLKRLRKTMPQGVNPFTRAQIPQVVAYLSRAELLPSVGGDLVAMRDRIRTFTPELVHNATIVDELVETILAIRPVEERLKADIDARRTEIEAHLRRDIEEQIRKELQQQMEALTTERTKLSVEVAELSAVAEHNRHEASKALSDAEAARLVLKDELSNVLSQLTDAAPGTEETVGALAATLGSRLKEPGSAFGILASTGAPWTRPDFNAKSPQDWGSFGKTLANTADRYGCATEDLTLADIAARAGELVVLPESLAARFVQCYADAICAGDMMRHVLDPSQICVDDLWRHPASGQPSAFGRAWAAASFDPRRYRIVLLDGMQRTPIDLWVPTLASLLEDPRRPANLLVFASIGGSLLDADRSWQDMHSSVIAISPNEPSGLTPRLIAWASGRPLQRVSFDALNAPISPRDEIFAFLERLEDQSELRTPQRAAAAYRAAWALNGTIDIVAWAAAFANAKGADPGVILRLSQGATWLRELLMNQE